MSGFDQLVLIVVPLVVFRVAYAVARGRRRTDERENSRAPEGRT